ncbi:hypothetical protein IC575_020313 [Cucumis melo]|uniref:Fe2OG dioxygenase domain-containing protein n=1 Tax=Cucumis melo TaxID=3656 RepID=A0A9I9DY57_CUCME
MFFIRTLPLPPSPSSNQLRRLLFPASSFPGARGFSLLQFQRMDSFSSSANSHAPPDSSCRGNSCGCGRDKEHLRDRDNCSDVIFLGSFRVHLNPKEREPKSLTPLSAKKCDYVEVGSDKFGISSNEPKSYHYDEFLPVSRQNTRRNRIDLGSKRDLKSNARSFQVERHEFFNDYCQEYESSLPIHFGKKNEVFFSKRQSLDIGSKESVVTDHSLPFEPPFDICFPGGGNVKHRNFWRVKDSGTVKDYRLLRPGMVLLKHYITPPEQINIVKTCQKLGLGPGGFYQPSYKDGAKLRLRMMCLGLDWDPQTRRYKNKRVVDGNKPPDIPPPFSFLVKSALKDAHAFIKNKCNISNVEDILPSMSPDICIANFYTTSGRLGLHQDRDESKESLSSGLPVVSFSVGNTAEFLYGDKRDVEKAEKVELESGDVLIFGGESRHVFHGVSSIIPKSTPKFLLYHTGLRPGRLNLTFRKY